MAFKTAEVSAFGLKVSYYHHEEILAEGDTIKFGAYQLYNIELPLSSGVTLCQLTLQERLNKAQETNFLSDVLKNWIEKKSEENKIVYKFNEHSIHLPKYFSEKYKLRLVEGKSVCEVPREARKYEQFLRVFEVETSSEKESIEIRSTPIRPLKKVSELAKEVKGNPCTQRLVKYRADQKAGIYVPLQKVLEQFLDQIPESLPQNDTATYQKLEPFNKQLLYVSMEQIPEIHFNISELAALFKVKIVEEIPERRLCVTYRAIPIKATKQTGLISKEMADWINVFFSINTNDLKCRGLITFDFAQEMYECFHPCSVPLAELEADNGSASMAFRSAGLMVEVVTCSTLNGVNSEQGVVRKSAQDTIKYYQGQLIYFISNPSNKMLSDIISKIPNVGSIVIVVTGKPYDISRASPIIKSRAEVIKLKFHHLARYTSEEEVFLIVLERNQKVDDKVLCKISKKFLPTIPVLRVIPETISRQHSRKKASSNRKRK